MSLPDLSSIVAAFATGTYTVTRPAATTYTLGRVNTPSTSSFSFTGSIQPTTGKDLKRLPEGMQTLEVITIFTPVELKNLDQLTFDGQPWQVQSVEKYDTLGAYWRAYAIKVNLT